jgi:hypothetical protein
MFKKTLDDQIEHDLAELEKEIHSTKLAIIQNNATLAWHRQKQAFLLKTKAERAKQPLT